MTKRTSKPATLRDLRASAPLEDRNSEALRPRRAPYEGRRPDGTRCMVIPMWPATLEELRSMAKAFGDAAVADAQWSAIKAWFMDRPKQGLVRNDLTLAWTVVELMREHDSFRYNLPCVHGLEARRPMPALNDLSLECRHEAKLVAEETLDDWEKAGRPRLSVQMLKTIYQAIITSPAYRTRYLTDDVSDPRIALNTDNKENPV